MPSIGNTTPDYRRLLAAIKNEKPDRAPLYEFFSDENVQMEALGNHPMTDTLPLGSDEGWNRHIRLQYYLGYDYVSPWASFGFAKNDAISTTDSEGNQRYFLDDHNVMIKSREDFEKYPWPAGPNFDEYSFEYCSKHKPEGMALVANLGGGLLEWGMWLMGAEAFCLALYDDPDLVRDVLARINDQQVAVAKKAAAMPDVIACAMGDDMGFKTQTFIPPAAMREFIFPGLKRVVDAVHSEGRLFILHSCGNLTEIMDDLIDYVGIDAKHSFEDVIMPVADVQKRWGDRVALLGGVDVDKLTVMHGDDLRRYVASVRDACAPNGGYALGSGNSIANYIPGANLRIMCEEGLKGSR